MRPLIVPPHATVLQLEPLVVQYEFPPGVRVAPEDRAPGAPGACPQCGSTAVVMTSQKGSPTSRRRIDYYRCLRCVDLATVLYTRFRRVRPPALEARSSAE